MADEIKYNEEQLKVADHYMTTGHEKIDFSKKEESKSEEKKEDK